jgi:hypothetical protein
MLEAPINAMNMVPVAGSPGLLRRQAPQPQPNTVTGCLQAQVEGSLGRQHPQDIADEAQKAEPGPVFDKIWFMIVGGLEYLS